MFISAHKNFRVIAIAAPVPPYPGYPLDPPFRSRFQARFIDPVGSLMALSNASDTVQPTTALYDKIRDIVLSTQYASETRGALQIILKTTLPPFPQTSLLKLRCLLSAFPPPTTVSPSQLARLFLTIHPTLVYAPFQAWALLSKQAREAGLGELGSPSMDSVDEDIGLLGYRITSIKRNSETTAEVIFEGTNIVTLTVPAGSWPLRVFPFQGDMEFKATTRFMGLLTCLIQAHALRWDISLIPPALPSTASTSTSTLVQVFGQLLGYEKEVVHMFKELSGRDLVMRRKIIQGGATTWEARYRFAAFPLA